MIKYIIPIILSSIFFFAFIYYTLGKDHINYGHHKNTVINNLYLSIMIQTLLGDATIWPSSNIAKLIVCLQAISTFMFLYFPIFLYIK